LTPAVFAAPKSFFQSTTPLPTGTAFSRRSFTPAEVLAIFLAVLLAVYTIIAIVFYFLPG
jgi:hypothetical protein